jgi:hypothetical protein
LECSRARMGILWHKLTSQASFDAAAEEFYLFDWGCVLNRGLTLGLQNFADLPVEAHCIFRSAVDKLQPFLAVIVQLRLS